MKNIIQWLSQLIIQAIVASFVFYIFIGSNFSNPRGIYDQLDDIRINFVLNLSFYIMSGYFFSSFYFIVLHKYKKKFTKYIINITIFYIHAAVFLLLGKINLDYDLKLLFLSFPVLIFSIFLSNFIASFVPSVFGKREHKTPES